MEHDELRTSYDAMLDQVKNVNLDNDLNKTIATVFIQNHPNLLFPPRFISRIKTVNILIYELNKRGLITKYKLSYLSEILDEIKNPTLSESYMSHLRLINVSRNRQNNPPPYSPSVVVNNTSGLSPQVKSAVTENIGRRWMELARQLGMKDAEIDIIEEKYRDFRRVHKVLEWFERNVVPKEQTSKLNKALVKAKRKDISEMVERLNLL